MARALNRLTVREVAALKEPGRHADGGGMYLRITAAGARSWVFMATVEGKRAEIGLGAAAAVSLASARKLAGDMRKAVALGSDPRAALAKPVKTDELTVPTFSVFSDTYITSVEAGWKNPVHRQQWRTSLRDHAASLMQMPIDRISTEDVLALL